MATTQEVHDPRSSSMHRKDRPLALPASQPPGHTGFRGRSLRFSVKRTLDVVTAGGALLVLSPVMLAIALVIRWQMGSPMLYRQVRIGQHEQPFEILKFRTMINEVERDGKPLSPGERLTRLGWFLRRHSLDELPQLWNVVRGDLSLVGPRPLMPEYLGHYTEREQLRHTVPAGITGLAQVNGRNQLTWDEKLELDARYAETWSLRLDLTILVQTVQQVVHPEDVARNAVGSLAERETNIPAGPTHEVGSPTGNTVQIPPNSKPSSSPADVSGTARGS